MREKLTHGKKEKVRNKVKSKSGITLVALVVTIVVLLILAGVTINTILGDNGIITKAQQAKEKTIKSNTISEIQTEILIAQMDGDITQAKLEEILSKYAEGGATGILKDEDGNITGIKVEGLATTIPIEEIYNGALGDIQSVTASDIATAENKSEYYGKTVKYEVKSDIKINGSTSLQDFLKSENIEWKIFYAGKDFSTDNKDYIYLIASDYIKYDCCPPSATKEIYKHSDYKLSMDNVINDYPTGSASIAGNLQALNGKYYKYLSDNSTSSTNENMKAVAYMMDTNVWSRFAGEKAEYAIGGPTLEMVFNSYNQYYGGNKYQTRVISNTGYEISYDNGTSWHKYIENSADYLKTENSLYVINSQTRAVATWLASPSAYGPRDVMSVDSSGNVGTSNYTSGYPGFRPLVSLKSDTRLKPGAASDGADFVIK